MSPPYDISFHPAVLPLLIFELRRVSSNPITAALKTIEDSVYSYLEAMATSPSAAAVPKQHKQKPLESEMPEDPAERKRVLNVLAQRRYRRRKREQQAQLESFIKALGPGSDGRESSQNTSPHSDGVSTPPCGQLTLYSASERDLPSVDGRLDTVPPNQLYCRSPSSDDHAFPSMLMDMDSSYLESTFSNFINCPPESVAHTSESPTDSSSENGVPLPEDWESIPQQDLAIQFSTFLQNDEIQTSTFADDYLVSVPELDLLRASHTIALRLHSVDRLWDPAATSIFQSETSFDWSLLPENLRPTSAQLRLPHHPVLDLLPWPKVRTKLITMYNMPPETWPRHPSDKAEMSPFRLVCDMEDGGIRIYGDDPTSVFAWEVQQMFVNAWWWALDQNVICLSNQRKKARGEEMLRIGTLGS